MELEMKWEGKWEKSPDEINELIDVTIKQRMTAAVEAVKIETDTVLGRSGTGRRYLVPGTKNAWYTASSPGEPPASATGYLRQHILTEVSSDGYEGVVGTDVPYGAMLQFGTHGGAVIFPHDKKKVLAFGVDGKRVFAKHVIQGPIRPRPWLDRAFFNSLEKIEAIFSQDWMQ